MTDDFAPGYVIGDRYQVLGTLGRGGMASVYLAEDATLARRVAIKVLHQRFAEDAKFVERFRREAKAAAGLNHPNIVGVYDWGQVGAQNYIVMEYVRGETLKERIRRSGRLDAREAVAITLELLSAVAAAHARGVVHRDVKSQNILIDTEGRVKVTDFGIAQAGDPSMTEAGSILGTAQYLAPEQARGEQVDERSDLYSVGVVLYEMLTGTVPFKGDSAVTVALKHVSESPREPAELVPGTPYALNQIVLKALAKDPALRYANAAQFGADLRAALTGGPLLAAAYDADAAATRQMAATRAAASGGTAAGDQATRVMTARDRPAARPAGARPRPQGRDTPRRRRTPWWLWVLLAVLVVGLAVAGVFIYRSVGGGGGSAVPDVVGLKERRATVSLIEAGFRVERNEGFSDEYEEGEVYRQQPPAGTDLRAGGTVEIWVSQGARSVEVPDFSGQPPAALEQWLSDNDLEGERKTGRNDTVEKGLVYKTDPGAGEQVRRGATVTYWVSSGPRQATVPDVVGASQSDAGASIEAAGLVVGTVGQQASDTAPAGTVIGQDPQAGTKVDRGSPVNIIISSGPPTPSPTPTPRVEVPSVVSMDEGTATATLEAEGFVVNVVYIDEDLEPPGTVVAQNPAGGTARPLGSRVTITVEQV